MHTQLPLTATEVKKLEEARKQVIVSGRVFFIAIIAFSVILLLFYKLPSIEQFQKDRVRFVILLLFWLSPVVSLAVLYIMINFFMAPFTSDIENKFKTVISGIIDKKYITRKSKPHEGTVKGDVKKYTFFFVIEGEVCPVDKEHFDHYSEGQYIALHIAPESGFILDVESDNRRFMKTTV